MFRTRLDGYYRVVRSEMRGPEAFPLHDHEFGEIFWVDQGVCQHFCDGERTVMEEGDCCFLRPWDAHSLHGDAISSFYIFNIAFSWDSLIFVQQRYFPSGDGDPYGVYQERYRRMRLSALSLSFCRQSAMELLNGEPSLLKLERFLMDLLSHFSRTLPAIGDLRHAPPAWLLAGCEAMKQPANMRGGVARLAELCGRSPAHVAREFRRCYGQTPHSWIERLRMNYAAAQLAGTAKDILEISWDCGYESLSHFYLRFRHHFKLSPARYRRELGRQVYGVEP